MHIKYGQTSNWGYDLGVAHVKYFQIYRKKNYNSL